MYAIRDVKYVDFTGDRHTTDLKVFKFSYENGGELVRNSLCLTFGSFSVGLKEKHVQELLTILHTLYPETT